MLKAHSGAYLSVRTILAAGLLILSTMSNPAAQPVHPPSGPYLGQSPPGLEPQLFAPGIVSTEANEHGCTWSADGTEFYFTRIIDNRPTIMRMHRVDSIWRGPEVTPFSGTFTDRLPSLSPDGKTLYFESIRPSPEASGTSKHGPWYVRREGSTWGNPQPVILPTDSRMAGLSAAEDGSLYLRGIVCLEPNDHSYTAPQPLGNGVEGDYPWVAPDESLLLFCLPPRRDLAVSRRDADDAWSAPTVFLTGSRPGWIQGFPILSPCGRYVFFTANHDIYWVDSRILEPR